MGVNIECFSSLQRAPFRNQVIYASVTGGVQFHRTS